MSTTTSVQESLPLEEVNPCQFVVLSESALAHETAMAVCGAVLTRFDQELAFGFHFWKFKDLTEPAPAHEAAEALTRADVVLLSVECHDLPPAVATWLESSLPPRTKTTGALALMVVNSGPRPEWEALHYRMQYLAHRLRLEFLPLTPRPDDGKSDVPPALLEPRREDPANEHWGLNE